MDGRPHPLGAPEGPVNGPLQSAVRATLQADIASLRRRLALPGTPQERATLKAALATVRQTALTMELL